MPPLVLASSSPYRAMLLDRLGVPFTQTSPGVDEAAVKAEVADPAALAERLAVMKAEAVAAKSPGSLCLGSDQVAVAGGAIVDKPSTVGRAVAQLAAARDGGLSLFCGVAAAGPGGVRSAVVHSRLTLHRLTNDQIRGYVDRVRPLDCAGSFKLEEPGGVALFERIDSSPDWSAVIGLPLLTVAAWLRESGYDLP